ncbi:MAG: glutamate--tRNA ligase [Bacteroidetes bacterium]|nr:glutamate--tRNA ligase [Bacteroidota bacterium]
MKTRIAPTPSGYLHPGNVLSFALTWLEAKKQGGKILLRIDDGDSSRKRPEYVEDIFITLESVGISWDEGPTGPDDFERNWSQRHRMDMYQEVLKKIRTSDQVYACQCSRKEVAADSLDGLYGGKCRSLRLSPKGNPKPCNWRLKTDPEDSVACHDFSGESQLLYPGKELGDFVIRKKDKKPAYQLSSVLDDIHFGITHIVRGMDLLPSTGAQLLLSERLQEVHPPFDQFQATCFYHHPLILGADGEKLSKSAGVSATGGWIKEKEARRAFFETLAKVVGWEIVETEFGV